MRGVAVLVLAAGCGRIGFAGRGAGRGDGGGGGLDGSATCATCDQGLVAHWRLDETSGAIAHDDIAGHDGVITAPASWGPGRVGGALVLAQGYVTIDWSISAAAPSAFTIAMWVRTDPGSLAYDRYASSYFYRNGNDHGTLFLDENASTHGLRCEPYVGGSWHLVDTDQDVTPGTWQHIACSYDGARVVAYVDGAEVGEQDASGAFDTTAPYPFVIGASMDSQGDVQNPATAAFDDLRVYDRALAPAELAALAAP